MSSLYPLPRARSGAGTDDPERRDATDTLVCLVSRAAASASEKYVPRPVRNVLDRTLVDLACATSGGLDSVAGELYVDIPAVDAWRKVGVPTEFRARLTAMTMRPPTLPNRRAA